MNDDIFIPTDFRCCMCPNSDNSRSTICPSGGPKNKPETRCRFILTFLDNKKRKVFIFHDIVTKKWVSVIQKTKHMVKQLKVKELPARKYDDEAQHDLNIFAMKRGWTIYE